MTFLGTQRKRTPNRLSPQCGGCARTLCCHVLVRGGQRKACARMQLGLTASWKRLLGWKSLCRLIQLHDGPTCPLLVVRAHLVALACRLLRSARSIAASPHKPPGRAHLSDARWTHCTCRAAASGCEVLRWQPATAAHCTRVLQFIAAAARSTADAPHRLAAHCSMCIAVTS